MTTVINKKRWPIVSYHFSGESDTKDTEAYIADRLETLARREAHVAISDFSEYGSATSHQRKLVSDFIKENKMNLLYYCLGTAIVLKSAVLRGALTAVFWVSPPPYPYKVCQTFEEALAWAEEIVRQAKEKKRSSEAKSGSPHPPTTTSTF